MFAVILVLHLMIALALVGVVLLQRSEGGALGMGGGGGGFMTGRGAANVLTRTTAILAAAFFATSLYLAHEARGTKGPTSVIQSTLPEGSPDSAPKSTLPAPAPLPSLPAAPSVPVPQQ